MKQNLAFFQILYGDTELYVTANQKNDAVELPPTKPFKVESAQAAEPNVPVIPTPKSKTYPAEPICLVTDVLSEENHLQVTRMLGALKFEPSMVIHRQMVSFEKSTLLALAKTSKAKHLLVFTNESLDDEQLSTKFFPFLWDELEVARFDSFDSIRTSGEVKLAVWSAINQLNF